MGLESRRLDDDRCANDHCHECTGTNVGRASTLDVLRARRDITYIFQSEPLLPDLFTSSSRKSRSEGQTLVVQSAVAGRVLVLLHDRCQ